MKGSNHRSINDDLWCLQPYSYTAKKETNLERKVYISYKYNEVASSKILDTLKDVDSSTDFYSDVNSPISLEQLVRKIVTKSVYQQSYNIVSLKNSDSSAMVIEPCTSSLVEFDEENYKLFSARLYDTLRNDSFIDGETCSTEIFLLKQFDYLGSKRILDYIMRFYLPNYGNYHMMCGLIHALSHFEYNVVSPQGPILALALFSHRDIEVKEFSLKAFENWKAKESVSCLEATVLENKRLDDYRKAVITYIKG